MSFRDLIEDPDHYVGLCVERVWQLTSDAVDLKDCVVETKYAAYWAAPEYGTAQRLPALYVSINVRLAGTGQYMVTHRYYIFSTFDVVNALYVSGTPMTAADILVALEQS